MISREEKIIFSPELLYVCHPRSGPQKIDCETENTGSLTGPRSWEHYPEGSEDRTGQTQGLAGPGMAFQKHHAWRPGSRASAPPWVREKDLERAALVY